MDGMCTGGMAAQCAAQVYVLDSSAQYRAKTAGWLRAQGYAVRTFTAPDQALACLSRQRPVAPQRACLMLDVHMADMSGLALHTRLIELGVAGPGGGLPVIYVSACADVGLAVEAMEKGAVTFLEKPLQQAALNKALDKALNPPWAGPLRPPWAGAPAHRPSADAVPPPPQTLAAGSDYGVRQARFEALSRRERQVLEGVLKGQTNKHMARELGLSSKTVELHRARMMGKLQAKHLAQLIQLVAAHRMAHMGLSAAPWSAQQGLYETQERNTWV